MKKYIIILISLIALVACNSDEDDITLQYELKTSVVPTDGGSIEPLSGMYNQETEIILTAIPAEGYILKNWSGCVSGIENPVKVTMSEDRFVTAVFEKIKYSLTINIQGNGNVYQEVILNKSKSEHEIGTTIQLTAVPDEDWRFTEWSGDYSGSDNPLVITMNEPMNLTANFETDLEKTYIPDDKFEQALIDEGYDDVLDDYVFTKNISNIEDIDLRNRGIDDLTGIEDFKSLLFLECSNNNLITVELSNPILTWIDLSGNHLSSLDLSAMRDCFWGVDVTDNPLTCVQVNAEQLKCTERVTAIYSRIIVDEGVIISEDCGY